VSPGKIQSVSVEPCSAEPCTVKNGDDVSVATNFISTHDTSDDCVLKASVLISGGWYEIFSEPACGGDVDCPLKTGQTYTLTKSLHVSDKLSKGLQTTKWKLICNGAADEIFCGDVKLNVA
ncbi:PREDICTED: epididymal secretory protein E1-like, partial [Rhagoletis zephyria]|uniref:epididymal secretory protein E1-like n=1 Tax=Rhagoletis zephyria TaxID=28612 RepID=UPI00081182CC